MKKTALIVFFFIGGISMVIMSNHYFWSDQTGILKRKAIADDMAYLFIFRIHVFCGLLAILSGPLQFLPKFRTQYKIVHRRLGYLYVTSVLLSSIAGLLIAPFAMGGWMTAFGFSLLSMVWFYSTLKAVTAIKSGGLKAHRKWMFLSYGLTFSAITQRSLLLIPLLTEVSFMPIYQLSAWLPWLLNGSIAYFLFRKKSIGSRRT